MLISKAKRPAPQNLGADTQGSFNRVWWDRYVSRRHVGMTIYRYLTYANALAHVDYTLVDEDAPGRLYKDNDNTLVVSQEYHYRVASIDEQGNESELSNVASVIYTGLKTKDLSINAITEIVTKSGNFSGYWTNQFVNAGTEHLLKSAAGDYVVFENVSNPVMVRATGTASVKLKYIEDGSDGKMYAQGAVTLYYQFGTGTRRKVKTFPVKLKKIRKGENVDNIKIDHVFKINPNLLFPNVKLFAEYVYKLQRDAGDGWVSTDVTLNVSATWNKR